MVSNERDDVCVMRVLVDTIICLEIRVRFYISRDVLGRQIGEESMRYAQDAQIILPILSLPPPPLLQREQSLWSN